MQRSQKGVATHDGPRVRALDLCLGDWRKYYDTIRLARAGELGGRKVYGVQLESAGLPPMRVTLDAETGDGRMIFQVERVEVGVELPPDTFTLGPFTASSGGR